MNHHQLIDTAAIRPLVVPLFVGAVFGVLLGIALGDTFLGLIGAFVVFRIVRSLADGIRGTASTNKPPDTYTDPDVPESAAREQDQWYSDTVKPGRREPSADPGDEISPGLVEKLAALRTAQLRRATKVYSTSSDPAQVTSADRDKSVAARSADKLNRDYPLPDDPGETHAENRQHPQPQPVAGQAGDDDPNTWWLEAFRKLDTQLARGDIEEDLYEASYRRIIRERDRRTGDLGSAH